MKNLPYTGFKLVKWTLSLYLFVGIFSHFLAGDVPIFQSVNGRSSFPVFAQYFNDEPILKQEHNGYKILPFIPYSPQNMDEKNQKGVGPFDAQQVPSWKYRHWLGTDNLGRDVASGMIHGTATALKIGLLSVLFSFLVGVSIGLSAAYFGNHGLAFPWLQLCLNLLFIGIGFYYSIYEFLIFNHQPWLFLLGLIMVISIAKILNPFLSFSGTKIHIPLDSLLLKIIEIRKSIPALFLILGLTALFSKPSIWNIILIISMLGWIEFARYARAETLAIKQENYIISMKISGMSHFRIMYKHIFPNLLTTLLVVACFSIGSAVLLESSLSFLGIGLPTESVSWGKLLSAGRNMRAWWLVVFPGAAIFGLLISLNTIVEYFENYKNS